MKITYIYSAVEFHQLPPSTPILDDLPIYSILNCISAPPQTQQPNKALYESLMIPNICDLNNNNKHDEYFN